VKVTGITPGEWSKQQKKMAHNDIPSVGASSVDSLSPSSISRSSTEHGTPPESPSTSLATGDASSSTLHMQASEEEWLKLVDFDAICDSIDWNAFQV
jgi:hypothetical protein